MKCAALFLILLSAASGASDGEIKIGNIVPYTGSFSAYGAIGRAEAAYFRMLNQAGGMNGRKINFISLDSESNTDTAVTLAHRLVEQDQVLLTVSIWGAPANMAIRTYMNEKHVPQLFAAAESDLNDPSHFPWTMGFQPSRRTEALEYARYILQARPTAKIAILYPADSSAQEWMQAVKDGLGNMASPMIVKELSFDYADPASLGTTLTLLKNSGADVFLNLVIGKAATEVILKASAIGWHPLQLISNASLAAIARLAPADRPKAAGIVTNARSKSWLKPSARNDPAVRAFLDWMAVWNPQADLRDPDNVYGYEVAQTVVEVLKKCGDTLTRDNVMKQAASLDLQLGMLHSGIKVTTSPTDYQPIKKLFMIQFDGQDWVSAGKVTGR